MWSAIGGIEKAQEVNDWSAICWADGEIYKAKDYKGLEIMDRVGGGDSFASGVMTTENAELAVNYGAAHGALAMTTPGDTTMASKKEVETKEKQYKTASDVRSDAVLMMCILCFIYNLAATDRVVNLSL